MLSTVVGWDLYQATRSPVVLGNVGLVQILPVLLLTFAAGHVADRYDRRGTLLVAQSIVASMGLVLAFSGASRGVTLIYSCLFLSSMAHTFQFPAASSLLPMVVPLEHLSNAISWNGMGREMATFTGPAIAGLLLASLGSSAVYLAQAACSILTTICFFRAGPQGSSGRRCGAGRTQSRGRGSALRISRKAGAERHEPGFVWLCFLAALPLCCQFSRRIFCKSDHEDWVGCAPLPPSEPGPWRCGWLISLLSAAQEPRCW